MTTQLFIGRKYKILMTYHWQTTYEYVLTSCKVHYFTSVVMKRRSPRVKTTETSTKAAAATTGKEMVRYASGTVQMGPNIAYEEVKYPEEAIYEHPD